MKNKVLFIKNINEFNELRNINGDTRVTAILLDDLDFKGENFEPIEFNGKVDLILRGFGMNIKNMNIISEKDDTGIFRKLNNLNIKDVNFFNIHTYGKSNSGSIVGRVDNKLTLIHSLIATRVSALGGNGLALGACETFIDHNNTFVKLGKNKNHEETNENKTGIILSLK